MVYLNNRLAAHIQVKMSLKFVPRGPVDNKSALVERMPQGICHKYRPPPPQKKKKKKKKYARGSGFVTI